MWISRRSPPPSVEHVRHSTSKKRAQLLLAVSEQSPNHFHSPYLPCVPTAGRRRVKAKFQYEDLKQVGEDLSSVRPSLYYDTWKGQESSRKYRSPYYSAYRKCKEQSTFGICEGMCSEVLRSRGGEIRREEKQLSMGKKLRLRRKPSSSSVVPNPFDSSVVFKSADSYGRIPGVESIRLRHSSKPSFDSEREDSLQSSRELDEFDLRLTSSRKESTRLPYIRSSAKA